MANPKRTLVLHLAGVTEPLLVAVADDTAETLAAGLTGLLGAGGVEQITAANGSTITVNFAHVAAAHVDDSLPGIGQIYGSPPRER